MKWKITEDDTIVVFTICLTRNKYNLCPVIFKNQYTFVGQTLHKLG